jgi:TRAP-type C4-dicarboxylate transport system permease small subunit
LAQTIPPRIRALVRAAEAAASALAYVSGAVMLLLALFITVDVLGRRFGGFYSGATDEIAVYAMALATSWALSYALAVGRHIRIDVCLPLFPRAARRVLDYAGLALLGAFAGLLAFNTWDLALESYRMDSRSMALQVRTAIPQAVAAAGFTFLALQAALMLLASPYSDLEELHKAGRDAGPEIFEI